MHFKENKEYVTNEIRNVILHFTFAYCILVVLHAFLLNGISNIKHEDLMLREC